ncbi:MAG: hypothetical protein QOD77_1901 [Thermoplasmata archaeon]|nr:hypothetical protein [Thermoplasmata archaeon]
MRIPLLLLAAALLAAPQAQAQADAFELTVGHAANIPYNGTGDLPVTLVVGCGVLLQSLAPGETAAEATFTLANPPAWLNLSAPLTLSYDPADCTGPIPPTAAPSGAITGQGVLKLKAGPLAPGVVNQTVNVTATLGDETQTKAGSYNVTYHAAHTITPSITFPYTMTSGEVTFQLRVTIDANARSMVMFTNIQADRGTIQGFQSEVYEPPAVKTFNITYKAPAGAWTEAHVKFHNYSHILLKETGKDGPAQLAKDHDWVFVNGNPDGVTPGTDSEPAPDGMALVAALGILGAALVARRK